ncbi:erythromycin esterase family protein [Clostridium sp. ATCC 25772]|uniref:erythromycin esterase family protein n=1 Tax=Clostridium sp. ATCC 25772 TaxID=1676991 RepID=UPI000782B010|nr:erythromycin esterase family protein [Clostridium sp. ATCC 25772]
MKKKGIIIGIIIIIIAVGMGIVYNVPMNNVDYVKKNSRELKLNDINDNKDLDLILDNIKDKNIVFTNETHGMKENTYIKEKFINYLMDNWNLKYFFVENGYAECSFINEYLQTGDEKLLNDIFNNFFNIVYTEDEKQVLKKIYLKNKELPDEKKLKFVGIEAIESYNGVKFYFNNILEKYNNLPKEQIAKIEKILECNEKEELYTERSNEYIKAIEEFENDIKENNEAYIKHLNKEEVFNIEFILNNLKNMSQIGNPEKGGPYVNKEFYETRDKLSYENIISIYDHFGEGKTYIHYGIAHAYQSQFNGVKFLAKNLNDDLKFNGKIYSINTVYEEGERFNNFSYETERYNSITTELQNTLKDAGIENSNRIIPLDNKKSPYKKKMYKELFELQYAYGDEEMFKNDKGVTTDFFQAEIVIKNPRPIEWNDEEFFKELRK